MMQREYFYIENKEDWPEEIVKNKDVEEHNDLFEFTMANLNTTEEEYKKDCSEVSEVLAPYNSTISADDIASPRVPML